VVCSRPLPFLGLLPCFLHRAHDAVEIRHCNGQVRVTTSNIVIFQELSIVCWDIEQRLPLVLSKREFVSTSRWIGVVIGRHSTYKFKLQLNYFLLLKEANVVVRDFGYRLAGMDAEVEPVLLWRGRGGYRRRWHRRRSDTVLG
jgi:hypothetical protein